MRLLATLLLIQTPVLAQWTKTIDCPADRVYRDRRNNVGGAEFCEQALPGSLVVKDGPYRFWFNPKFQGEAGNCAKGREVGTWKECNRFGRCEPKQYPGTSRDETHRPGYRPEVPICFSGGKYMFDFASCRTTWVTQIKNDKPVLIYDSGDYQCKIPYSVGKREFDSLDLRAEFPKLGLPQFCALPHISESLPARKPR